MHLAPASYTLPMQRRRPRLASSSAAPPARATCSTGRPSSVR